jgi:adenylate cyclase
MVADNEVSVPFADGGASEAVRRVLDSAAFARAEQARRFLAYVAHETLEGRSDGLNERSIARLALGRSVDFDARDDAGVRVLATRVRARLDQYYDTEGRLDPIRLSIPRGQYALAVTAHQPIAAGRAPTSTDGPMIAVTRFVSDGPQSDVLAAGLSESLVHALTRFPGVRVAGPLTAGDGMSADAVDTGNRTAARFVLYGSVRLSATTVRANVRVAETTRGEVVWSEQFDADRATFGGFGVEDDIVERLAGAVADYRGVALRSPAGAGHLSDQPAGYLAIAGFYRFLDTLDLAEGLAVLADLEAAALVEPDNAVLLGLVAAAHAIPVLMFGAEGASESFATAQAYAERALLLDPRNPHAHSALATLSLAAGDPDACLAHLDVLLDEVPHHPSFLYQAGLLTAGCGRWDDGIAIIERAIRLNPHHPSHQRVLLVIDRLRRGDVAAALNQAQLVRFDGYIWGPLCLAICLEELGLADEARREVAALEAVAPDFFDRPADHIGAAPAISADILDFLVGHVDDLAALRA